MIASAYSYRTTMLALFAVAAPVSQFVGAPISAGLLQMSGVAGLAGWQWMFLIEGIPAILVGIAALWVLSDTPADASWMPEEERDVLMKALAGDVHDRPHSNMRDTFRDPRAWIMAGITFCFTIGSYGVSLWLPLILKGHDLSTLTIGWLSMLPYAAATIATLAWARYVDRTGKRTFSLICALTLGLLGLLASTRFPSLIPALLSLTAALAGMIAARTIFYTIPQIFLTGAAAAGGLALINSVGAFGGFVGPAMVGWLKDRTGSYDAGLLAMAALMVVAIVSPLC